MLLTLLDIHRCLKTFDCSYQIDFENVLAPKVGDCSISGAPIIEQIIAEDGVYDPVSIFSDYLSSYLFSIDGALHDIETEYVLNSLFWLTSEYGSYYPTSMVDNIYASKIDRSLVEKKFEKLKCWGVGWQQNVKKSGKILFAL